MGIDAASAGSERSSRAKAAEVPELYYFRRRRDGFSGTIDEPVHGAKRKANGKIEKLNDIKKAFSVFASVIGLAQAIVSASPVGILDAFGALKEAEA